MLKETAAASAPRSSGAHAPDSTQIPRSDAADAADGADAADAADAASSARAAGLRYVTDDSPGIRRRGRPSGGDLPRAPGGRDARRAGPGKGFTYVDAQGKALRDAVQLARIRALAIPPAWTAVWICPQANGHLQATGRDARGRKQYRYHGGA
jgi:DNA topoisomerase-1